jgi:O-antigen/teichoic acid export membrane protein
MHSVNLVEKARSGLLWSGGFRLLQNLVQFGLTLILARLLIPEEYGTYAVVAGIIGFVNAVSFESFLRHLLQIRDESKVYYQDHFTAAVCLQGAIFLLSNLVGVLLRWVPAYADIAHYIHVMSPVILLSSVGGFRYVMLEKELDWKRYRVLQAIGLVFTTTTALGLAWCGAGVYALLLAPLGKYIPPAVDLFFVKKWRPSWEFSWQRYKPAFQFGFNRVGAGLVGKGRILIESNMLLLLIGFAFLGYLNRSIGLTQLIALQFATLVGQALYPVLSRIEPGTERFRRASGLVFRGIAWVIIPVSILLGILAVPVVNTLFGAKWMPSAELLPYALACGTVAGLGQAGYFVLLGNQGQRRCLYYDILRLGGLLLALCLWGVHGSLIHYLVVLAGCELLALGTLLFWLCLARAMRRVDIATALAPPLLVGVLGFLSVLWFVPGEMSFSLFSWSVLWTISVFGAVWLVVIRGCFGQKLAQLFDFVPFGGWFARFLLIPSRPRPE